jgi:hypothetical protein
LKNNGIIFPGLFILILIWSHLITFIIYLQARNKNAFLLSGVHVNNKKADDLKADPLGPAHIP